MRAERNTFSDVPEAHTPDVREIVSGVSGYSKGYLAERHKIHGEYNPEGDMLPNPQTVSKDPNAHSKE